MNVMFGHCMFYTITPTTYSLKLYNARTFINIKIIFVQYFKSIAFKALREQTLHMPTYTPHPTQTIIFLQKQWQSNRIFQANTGTHNISIYLRSSFDCDARSNGRRHIRRWFLNY